MKSILLTMALGLASTGLALAQAEADKGHAAHHAASATSQLTEGEVRKIDKENKKITLKHAEIKSLDMPPMTMVFRLKEPAWLDQLKVGSKVRFAAENSAAGMVVTELQVAP